MGTAGPTIERQPSSVKSRCGGPPTASTPTTIDPPDPHNCRPLREWRQRLDRASPRPAPTQPIWTGGKKSGPGPSRIVGDGSGMTGPNHPRSVRARPDLPGRTAVEGRLSPSTPRPPDHVGRAQMPRESSVDPAGLWIDRRHPILAGTAGVTPHKRGHSPLPIRLHNLTDGLAGGRSHRQPLTARPAPSRACSHAAPWTIARADRSQRFASLPAQRKSAVTVTAEANSLSL